ncbi:MAG: Hsp70 family protein [Ruminococcus sp.]|nr:Hsp70 family protein [Ruminococcus sp.]
MSEKYVFGIDLGTTYSCISYFDENGQCVTCPSVEGETTIPSVVRMEPGTDPIVGNAAKNTAILYPETTIQFVKSRIGIEASFNYGPEQSYTTTPVEVSAEILKKIAHDGSVYTNSDVKRVVITVPAYFGDAEKRATKEAGEAAGLDVLGIIEEPTAAAIYYGMNKSDQPENVIVFDLGGGTFDVTAMEIKERSFRTITTEGDHDLGGKNWDIALIDLVKEKFREETGYDDEYDPDIEQDLLIACEEAKKILTQAESTVVPVKVDRQYKAAIEITRKEFEDATSSLLDSAVSLTRKVIERVEVPLTKILLVGGSTYMPQVKKAIEENFPQLEINFNEPNTAVAKGASIYAFMKYIQGVEFSSEGMAADGAAAAPEMMTLPGEKIETYENIATLPGIMGKLPSKIVTIANKSLGIRMLLNGELRINNLIMKDTELPASVSATYGTNEDNATNIPIDLFQVNNYEQYYDVDEDLKIGTAMLVLDGTLPKNSPIEVTLSLVEDGCVHVKGLDKTRGAVIEADIVSDAVGQKS